jgi:colanic acid/amylovoran biosynthesis glycosyltransferase
VSQYFPTVAHIISTYLNHTENWIYNQVCNSRQWRSIIFCQKIKNLDIFPFERIYSQESLSKSLQGYYNLLHHRVFGYFPYFRQAVKIERVKILHAHFGPTGYKNLALAFATKIPLITTFYGYDLSGMPVKDVAWYIRYQKLFEGGHMFLVEGPHMRQQLIQLGCPPEKVQVQRLGVDLDVLPFTPRRIRDDGIIHILSAARFKEKKGLVFAIEAFSRLCSYYENIRLTVIGDALDSQSEQTIKDQLHSIVEEHNIKDKVYFLGHQSHETLINHYYRCHIFLSPSVQAADGDNEGGAPVSIIEASASGMPVISTTHCDIPSVITHGKSGFLVEERNVDSLIQALSYLIEHPDQWEIMGNAGRTHIEREFNIKITVPDLEKKYNSLLS